jgi:Uma2 family endonuclease
MNGTLHTDYSRLNYFLLTAYGIFMDAVAPLKMTAEEYLAWEEKQPTKHEFYQGLVYEVYAMTGARDAHVTVTLNVAALFKSHLRGTPCRTYIADMKLQAEELDAYFYPDVFVTCDPRDKSSEYHKAYPTLIVEVLSPSTADYDRGDKFAAYRKIASLKEYVVINPSNGSVDLFRKSDTGCWTLHPTEGQTAVEFASIGLSAALADIFEDVEFSNPPRPA